MSTEEIYDKEIAPLMARIIAICKANKIPVVAAFELTDKNQDPVSCLTSLNTESAAMRMLHYMAKCGNNLDLFIITIQRDKTLMEGHTSAILHLLEPAPSVAERTEP
jgi:CMP-2-keto-3-deoxyoctulosonic acid synthetase